MHTGLLAFIPSFRPSISSKLQHSLHNRAIIEGRLLFSLGYAAEGLVFGNSVYWIRFDEEFSEKKFKSSSPFGIKYKFHLEDAVDCPEWVVPFHVFKALAEEYDLELVFAKNSHEFVHEYLKRPEYVDLMRRLGALGDGTLSQDEWEVAYLYLAFVLKKRGQPDRTQANNRKDTGQMNISKEDIMYISG
ncbi:mRNA cap guanine-N7 methyltransferase 1 [Fagus crenata]